MLLTPIGEVRERFEQLFQSATVPRVARAPGRVNLIGEHTDYNEGFVMPMAIDLYVATAFAPRDDRLVRVHAVATNETRQIELDGLAAPGGTEWSDYVAAVAWALADAGEHLSGIDVVVSGNIPIGSGLSSSAALEMAVARALCHSSEIEWDPPRMAQLCQRAENIFVGVNCGIMDQFAAAASRAGCALLLDCRSLEAEPVAIPDGTVFVVLDTGVRRTLSQSAYNERRASCEAAVDVLRSGDPSIRALRDVRPAALESMEHLLDPESYRRAAHVVAEIRRPGELAESLAARDLERAGRVMNESHASLRDLYEVSSPELDAMTEAARGSAGCFGARMTGAGFGGCAVALVGSDRVDAFTAEVAAQYASRTGRPAQCHVCTPSAGADLV
ncbi:MAG: galactokinase [Gemmatimonadota bacterium]|nr:MAG: galactokinase [Gemmatimonadota bacterium]